MEVIDELIKKEEYLNFGRRAYNPFWASLVVSGCSKAEYYQDFLDEPMALTHHVFSNYHSYFIEKELDEIGKRFFSFCMDPENFEKMEKIFRQRERELLRVSYGNLKDLIEPFEKYMPTVILILGADKMIEDELRRVLVEKFGKSRVEKYFDKLSIPLEDNFYKKEEYDLVNAKDISAHLKEYEWIRSKYGKKVAYTKKDALEKLKGIDREEFLLEWEESKKELQKTIKEVKDALGSEHSHIVDFAQFIIFYRTQRTDIINGKVAYEFAKTLEKMANDLGLTYEQILHCTKDELLENKIPSIDEIQERMRGFSNVLYDGKVKCYSGKDHQKIVDYLKEEVEEVSEIKGTLACKGVVQGRVKSVLSIDDFEKVNVGDVLVASMTTPEFLPIMKKASSFVTNEGGITCHAAIISREMKKPCIIGTKIATQVLKDGDLVEVDAEKGVVKILKRVGEK